MEKPLVSCITTTCRKFRHIYETIDSILMQDYPNIEIVLGDDGSEDFPGDEIRGYIDAHKRDNIKNVVILHSEENHGTVWNCANCRKHASGEYLMGIASDDRFYDSAVVSDVVDFFQKTGADIITCKRLFVDEETGKSMNCMPFRHQRRWMKKLTPEKMFQKMASFSFISGSNTYCTKSFYEISGGYDRAYKYIEDCPFFLKIYRGGGRIEIFDRISIRYRYGRGISTASNKNNAFREAMYKDRIRYMTREIIPYMEDWPWWRKAQMRTRLYRFRLEQEAPGAKLWKIYLKLFTRSPVGTLVQIYYQLGYKLLCRIPEKGA